LFTFLTFLNPDIRFDGEYYSYSPSLSDGLSPTRSLSPYSDDGSEYWRHESPLFDELLPLQSPTIYPNDTLPGFDQSQLLSPMLPSVDSTASTGALLSPLTSYMDQFSLGDEGSSSSSPSLLEPPHVTYRRDRGFSHSEGTEFGADSSHGRLSSSAPPSRTRSRSNVRPANIYIPYSTSMSAEDLLAAFLREDVLRDENAPVDGSAVDGSTVSDQNDIPELLNFQQDIPIPSLSVPSQGDFGEFGYPFLTSPDGVVMFYENSPGDPFVQQPTQSGIEYSLMLNGEPNSPSNEDHGSSSPSSTHSYVEHHNDCDDNTHSNRGRRHHRRTSSSSSSQSSRNYSPYLRPEKNSGTSLSPTKNTDIFLTVPDPMIGGELRRRHSDGKKASFDGRSLSRSRSDPFGGGRNLCHPHRRTPPGFTVESTAHPIYGGDGEGRFGVMGSSGMAAVDLGSLNGGETMTMTPENPPGHQFGGQTPVIKRKVASDAIVTASHGRRKKEARFVCPIPGCDATFTANHNLKSMLCVPFQFSCGLANSFAIDHLNSHNGIKDFKCEFCGAPFTTAGVLARHVRNTHGGGPPL
jgi:hypothetical protein